MAVTHPVDTRGVKPLEEPAVGAGVEPLAAGGSVARAGICDLEVGFSARSAKEWDSLQDALDSFALVETDASHVRRARQVQRMLAAQSQRGRKIPDLLVAAAAEEGGLIVIHYDADFDRIAAITGQRCEWIVPAGKVA